MPPGRRGKYLGFVAHEIKNPLATALWSCDLLKRMDAADRAGPRADKMIDASLRALRRMRRLVDDYFTMERLQEQGYELRPEPVELRSLVEGAISQLGEKEGMSTEGWSMDVPAQVQVAGDQDMLKRAIRLLLEHLARGAAGTRISVVGRGAPEGAQLVLRADPSPEKLVPPVPEERPSGDPTGAVLGFALADTILRAHQGSVEEKDKALFVVLPARS
ncbi:MAG: HAMP domain-containing histidine kinase [Deltaproteobacteria bacterium]|nr:MAG: HAMP domain-containing histidine kinase [Deltaproteobacteria bacterium]TMB34280.1 MAG: HAMP domain-containing histidine kinase [Deltaproteobacteria bacterium]